MNRAMHVLSAPRPSYCLQQRLSVFSLSLCRILGGQKSWKIVLMDDRCFVFNNLMHTSSTCSIASYDTREENTGVGLGDVMRDIQEYITGPADDDNDADNESEIERALLDNDSAHEDESLHKAFVRRRTMTVCPLPPLLTLSVQRPLLRQIIKGRQV